MNNFTSLDRYGVALVAALLAIPDVRVIYKPHPRVVLSLVPAIAAAHARVVARIAAAAAADPGAGHEYRADGDILALFPRVDLLVSDISSVGLDFLYSRAEAPIVLTDRRTDRAGPAARGADRRGRAHHRRRLDRDRAGGHRSAPGRRPVRRRAGHGCAAFYFDDAAPGESTRKFHEALLAAIAEHQAGLARMRAWPRTASGRSSPT